MFPKTLPSLHNNYYHCISRNCVCVCILFIESIGNILQSVVSVFGSIASGLSVTTPAGKFSVSGRDKEPEILVQRVLCGFHRWRVGVADWRNIFPKGADWSEVPRQPDSISQSRVYWRETLQKLYPTLWWVHLFCLESMHFIVFILYKHPWNVLAAWSTTLTAS